MGLFYKTSQKIWVPRKILRQEQRGLQPRTPKKRSRWWWQGQKEEVVQRKDQGQVEQFGLFDKPTYEKLLKEVPTYKLITPSIVSERLKVRGSLARKALAELTHQGLIRQVVQHSAQTIY